MIDILLNLIKPTFKGTQDIPTFPDEDGSRRGREIVHGMVTWRIEMAYEVQYAMRLSV
jgi:hypothetical protein